MTRAGLFAVLVAVVLVGASRADVEVAPPPRPAGVPFQPPAPATAPAEDPAATVGKIIKNSQDVTDRLAKNDISPDTRKTQDETLALIDSLLNRQPDMPPPSGDMNDDKKDKNDSKDKKDDPKPKGDDQPKDGKSGQKDKDDKGGKEPKDGEPKDGKGGQKGEQKGSRRPRSEAGKEPGQEKEPGGKGGKEPKGGMEPGGMEPIGGTSGKTPGASATGDPPKPSLPVDDDVAKDVWGHLPDKLRQQVTQYYKEEFMPRYADLLKQYYSSLSEKGVKSDKK